MLSDLETYPDFTIEGDFVDGKAHGKGKLTYPDGKVYEGNFSGGKPHGKGKITYPDGEVYEGDFADGKRHGKSEKLTNKTIDTLRNENIELQKTNEKLRAAIALLTAAGVVSTADAASRATPPASPNKPKRRKKKPDPIVKEQRLPGCQQKFPCLICGIYQANFRNGKNGPTPNYVVHMKNCAADRKSGV